MNKTITFLSCLFFALQIQAQEKPTITSLPDTLRLRLNKNNYQSNMPNAFQVNQLPNAIILGNNGQGFDSYALPIDNMPCLVPDKNNLASLQNGLIHNLPLIKDNFEGLMNQVEQYKLKKQIDSLLKAKKKPLLLPISPIK